MKSTGLPAYLGVLSYLRKQTELIKNSAADAPPTSIKLIKTIQLGFPEEKNKIQGSPNNFRMDS